MYTDKNCNAEFLEQMKAARDGRALEKKRAESAVRIQACVRGWLARLQYSRLVLEEYDAVFARVEETNFDLVPVMEVYSMISKFLCIWKIGRDKERFEKLCRYVVKSLCSESNSVSYVGVFLKREHSLIWIAQIKSIIEKAYAYLVTLNAQHPDDSQFMMILFHTMISFTSTSTWVVLRKNMDLDILRPGMNQFCNNVMGYLMKLGIYKTLHDILYAKLSRSTSTLSNALLYAMTTLAVRPLYYSRYSDHMLALFIAYLFSVPTYVYHIARIAPQCLGTLEYEKLLHSLMEFLKRDMDIKVDDFVFEGNNLICFMGNFIQLGHFYINYLKKEDLLVDFIVLIMDLLERCKISVQVQQSNLAHWHPVLGWFRQDLKDIEIHDFIPDIKYQLGLLWSTGFVNALLTKPLQDAIDASIPASSSESKSTFRKVVDYLLSHKTVDIPLEAYQVAIASSMYYKVLTTFTQLRLDVLTGLCYQGDTLHKFWKFFLHYYNGLKSFFQLVGTDEASYALVPNDKYMLMLFNECMTHFITILDDMEMYEERTAFTISDFQLMGSFLNMFIYKGITNDVFREEENDWTSLFTSSHMLLSVLYTRDCRRSYASKNHWLIKDIKISAFFSDLDKNKPKTKFLKDKLPHAIACKDRVHLFRKSVTLEKLQLVQLERNCLECTTIPVRVIRIRRQQIVEDAYCYMRNWSALSMKRLFRVKFVNAQGLEEAGVDQAGVFREFLEEFMKRIFNPGLNLFKMTSDEHLYPSPESYIHENHLQLIEFAGKMLAKAVFERVTVEVRLASFFLSQVLGQTQSLLYSYIDDLPSLDPELYRSLMYIKHYTGDVADLSLTFSTTEDVFGKIIHHELVPSGRVIAVNNSNKIIYVHMMAHFRMYTQIKKQAMAFSRGFHSLFSKEQLSLFSTPEFQLLISGKDGPINLMELRQYTQYYGGFHDSHKVVVWLWEVLQQDFNEEERGLFLKFVTSCSKAPILGFGYLHPPFSIRCVEVSEDEDTGDSVGSVIRGFFTIRRKGPEHRLPTSSTCFNLLKLPNYSRKTILRDKLRYAITSNTGFELS